MFIQPSPRGLFFSSDANWLILKLGFYLGKYEVWPRFWGVLMTVMDVPSSSGSTSDGMNGSSLSGITCNGTDNTPLKREPKWLVVFLDFSVIIQALFYECLRTSRAPITTIILTFI